MAGAAPDNKGPRSSRPYLPPLSHGEDTDAALPHQLPSLPIATLHAPLSAPLRSSGSLNIPQTTSSNNNAAPAAAASLPGNKTKHAEGDDEGEKKLPSITRSATGGVWRSNSVIGRARGMKPLSLRVKACPPSSPAALTDEGAEDAAATAPAKGPFQGTASTEERHLHSAETQPHPPSPPRSPQRKRPQRPPPQQQTATSFSLARLRKSTTPSSPSPPPNMDSVPAVYRPTAVQFSKAVLRLNKMTTSTCTAADTTSLEFVEERNGKRVDRRHADNGGPSYETPTPSLSLSRLRKLMHVSLLPLTICTDGAAVLLVDPNGTSRHGNYVQAVKTYLRRRATAQLSASSASRVLWWTAEDAHDCKGVLPLSRARASCADGDLAFGVSGDDCAPLTSSLAKVRCNSSIFLSSVQPDRLTLPFGNGLLLLLMPEAAGASTASADAALGDDARSKEQRHADADASPRAALHGVRPASPAASSLSQDLLTDLCHGYLPSLLESVYPNGGVQLRGCWCTLSSSGDESDVSSARHQQQPHNASHTSSRVSADGASSGTEGAVDDCVAALSIAEALVHPPHPLLTGTSEDPRLSSSAAAVAARVMQSLQPTSLPRAPARANDASQRDLPPALVLDLQPPVMQFALHLGVAAPMQTTKSSAEARSDENSEHVPQSLSSHPLSDTTTSKMRFPAGAMTPSLALAVHEADVVMGSDQRALITAARSTFSKSGLVFVGPLLRGSPRVFGTAAAALSARPAVEAHRSPCQSAMVLTPMGRVELVVEQGANKGLTGSVASASSFGSPVTIRDVKRSLCRCAVGQALQLTEADVALVYAPGTPVLQDQDEVPRSHVVLRLRRRSIHVR